MIFPKRINTDRSLTFSLLAILTIAGILGRLLPHAPNATPTVALGLLAGTVFGVRLGTMLLVAILAATDLVLGTYSPLVMVSVYACLALPALAGSRWIAERRRPLTIALSAAGCSLVFFAVTNLAVWVSGEWYARDFQGLVSCYAAALPFLRNMITADLVWSGVLFSALALLETRTIESSARVGLRSGN